MVNFLEIKEATMIGEQHTVAELTRQAIEQGAAAEQIIQDGFISAMGIVGEKFGAGEIYIPGLGSLSYLIDQATPIEMHKIRKPFVAG